MDKMTINCICQHIAAFHNQSMLNLAADFTAPCTACTHAKECNFDWCDKMKTLFEQSNVNLSLLCQGQQMIPTPQNVKNGTYQMKIEVLNLDETATAIEKLNTTLKESCSLLEHLKNETDVDHVCDELGKRLEQATRNI